MAGSAGVTLVQLDAAAPPGLVSDAVAEAGLSFRAWDAEAGGPLPDLATPAGLVLLGSAAAGAGAASAIVAALRERLRADRPVLGLAAGAALLAAAAGGRVRAGESHAFGYVDLAPAAAAANDPVLEALGTGLPVMAWHDDAIDPPAAAVVLACCSRGRPQAFRLGRLTYGLRFHPGATAEIVRRWAAIRAADSNNPAIRVRIGAEIVRHQERAERFGRKVVAAWLRHLG